MGALVMAFGPIFWLLCFKSRLAEGSHLMAAVYFLITVANYLLVVYSFGRHPEVLGPHF